MNVTFKFLELKKKKAKKFISRKRAIQLARHENWNQKARNIEENTKFLFFLQQKTSLKKVKIIVLML